MPQVAKVKDPNAPKTPRRNYGGQNGWVVKLLTEYKAECTVYNFETAYVFLHKRHRLACRFYKFRTLRENARMLYKYANEDAKQACK